MNRNCRSIVAPVEWVPSERGAVAEIQTGWVGLDTSIDPPRYCFRPDRGSGGFALYDTERSALRHTGCSMAARVSLALVL